MGGGHSALLARVPPEQRGEIARKVAEAYEKLKSEGASDETANVALQKLVQDLLSTNPAPVAAEVTKKPATVAPVAVPAAPAASPAKAAPAGGKGGAATAAAGGAKGGGKAAGKTPTRRRSFEPAAHGATGARPMAGSQSAAVLQTLQAADVSAAGAAAVEAATAASAAADEPPKDKDHWDSVSQLPYCSVCAMAFKSQSLLERHIKYSDLHERTVKKQQAEALAAATQATIADDPITALALQQDKQVEGKDFKHLYYGSKFFWRSQDNVDFTFFHHILLDTVEIVSFAVYKNKELNRVYLNHYKINMLLEKAGLLAVPDKFVNGVRERQEKQAAVDQKNRAAVTTFILSRLQLETKTGGGGGASGGTSTSASASGSGGGEQVVVYQSAATDDTSVTPVLTEKPTLLVPRPVVHRRNTSTEEVNRKLEDLRADQALLAAATSRAEKIGSYVVSFAASFKNFSERLRTMNAPRRRWVVAIHRVLQINGVERTTKFLEELDLARQNGTTVSPAARRGRSNTHDK